MFLRSKSPAVASAIWHNALSETLFDEGIAICAVSPFAKFGATGLQYKRAGTLEGRVLGVQPKAGIRLVSA